MDRAAWAENCEQILKNGMYLIWEEMFLSHAFLRDCLRYGVIDPNDEILTDMANQTLFYKMNSKFYYFIKEGISNDTEEKGAPRQMSLFLAILDGHNHMVVLQWRQALKKNDWRNNFLPSRLFYRILQKGQRLLTKPVALHTIDETTNNIIKKIDNISCANPPQRPRFPENTGAKFLNYVMSKDFFSNDMRNHPEYGCTFTTPLSVQDRKDIKRYQKHFEIFIRFEAQNNGFTATARKIFRDVYEFPDLSFFFFPTDTECINFILTCVIYGPYAPFLRLLQMIFPNLT